MTARVAVIGGSGFVGRHAVAALQRAGAAPFSVSAPRWQGRGHPGPAAVEALAHRLRGADTVVNAAGMADPTGAGTEAMWGANSVLPLVALQACRDVGVQRFVHVSSAAVQGRRPVLDDSWDYDGISPYACSKIDGERALRAVGGHDWVIYRPGGVHGVDRRVTQQIAQLARSPLAVVPRTPRTTPQALAVNVGSAIACLATCTAEPPRVVHHPNEGLTTHTILRALGGREPRLVPDSAAEAVLRSSELLARRLPHIAGFERRLATLWHGQDQATSWLEVIGWQDQANPLRQWFDLGRQLRYRAPHDVSPRGHH